MHLKLGVHLRYMNTMPPSIILHIGLIYMMKSTMLFSFVKFELYTLASLHSHHRCQDVLYSYIELDILLKSKGA
jgi:hypothetical protein